MVRLSQGVIKIMGRDMDKRLKWERDNIRRYIINVHKTNDKDVYNKLESEPNKRAYILNLIREDIKKEAD